MQDINCVGLTFTAEPVKTMKPLHIAVVMLSCSCFINYCAGNKFIIVLPCTTAYTQKGGGGLIGLVYTCVTGGSALCMDLAFSLCGMWVFYRYSGSFPLSKLVFINILYCMCHVMDKQPCDTCYRLQALGPSVSLTGISDQRVNPYLYLYNKARLYTWLSLFIYALIY